MATTNTSSGASLSEEGKKVLKQIEFYFSDSNFPRDKFLRAEASKDPQGFVDISILASFNRIKQITTDANLILEALRTSSQLEVSADGKKVRRIAPLPTEDVALKRTLYAKPFPEDATIESLTEFFSKYGEVLSVRLRKVPQNKKFKGSIFVEFATPEVAQKVLETDISFNDQKLTLLFKEKFEEEKKEEEKKRREEKKNKRKAPDGEGESKDGEAKEGETPAAEKTFVPGKIVHVTNIGTDKVPAQKVKALLGAHSKLSFLEYKPGDVEAWVRYDTPEDAKTALEKFAAEAVEIGGQKVTLALLEGEEEKKYWEKVWEWAAAKGKGKKGGARKGGKRRRY